MGRQLKYTFYVVSLLCLFFGACLLAVLINQPAIIFIPIGLMVGIWLLQNLQWLFFVLMVTIPWSTEFKFNPTLGTDLPDEPLMLLTALSVLIYCIANRKKILLHKLHPLLFIISLQIVWITVSVICSTDVLVSFKFSLAKGWFLLSFIGAPLILFLDEKQIKRTAIAVAISMFLLTCLALVKHASYGFTFARINDSLVPFFRNHVNYSAVLVFIIPLFASFYPFVRSRGVKALLIFILIILTAAVYLSYARGAWLALIIGVAAYWLLKKKALFATFIAVIIACLSFVYWLQKNDNYLRFAHHYKTTIFHTNFEEHLIATYKLKDVSTAERFYRWIAGARMIKDRWQTGYGPNSFYENYKEYGIPAFHTWVSDNKDHSTVHNYFLLTFIEQGLVGFVLVLLLFASFFWYAQKIYHRIKDKFWKVVVATVTVIFSMVCTVNFLSDLIETDKIGSFFYICIATLIVADMKSKKSNFPSHAQSIS